MLEFEVMRRRMRWTKLLVLGVAPMALCSCATLLATTVRDAVVDGVSAFTLDATVNVLDLYFGVNDSQPG